MNAERVYLISDASKKVKVESHVLRYWEDELKLPVKRNELGHRYYTEKDIEEFIEIKKLKEQGLQLKAIRMVLRDGHLEPLDTMQVVNQIETSQATNPMESVQDVSQENDHSLRLQLLLKRLIAEVVEEDHEKLYEEISGSLAKELDYQFRMQEEREEQRENRQMLLEEEHYKQLDALLRGYKDRKKQDKKRSGFTFRKIK